MSIIEATRRFMNFFASRRGENWLLLLCVILLGVVCLLTTRPGHDWGGDFAHYIRHAQNIATCRDYADTGYIYNPHHVRLAPKTYPPGFPLLLAPLYALFGMDIDLFKALISVLYVASFAVSVLYFREWAPPPLSLIGSALLFFNPWMLNFKNQVISDVPFLFFLLLTLLGMRRAQKAERPTVIQALVFGLLLAFTAAVRTPGVLLIPALLLSDLYRSRRVTRFAAVSTIVALTLVLLTRFAFGSETSYMDQFSEWSIAGVGNIVWSWFSKDLPRLFHAPKSLAPARYILSSAGVLLSLYGAIACAARRRMTVLGFFLVLYLALVAVWPTYQGLRFLIPALPAYFVFAVYGLHSLTTRLRTRFRFAVLGLAVLIIAASWGTSMAHLVADRNVYPDGPFRPEAKELFAFLKSEAGGRGAVVFGKPRTLALFTGRNATVFPYGSSDETAHAYFAEVGVSELISDQGTEEDGRFVVPFLDRQKDRFEEVFRNSRYVVLTYKD